MKQLLVLGLLLGAAATSRAGWVAVPLVTAESRARGHSGGEGGQNSRAIAIDSTGDFLVYGNDVAGYYRSLDGGTHWEPANIGMDGTGTHSIAIDPNNSDRVLAVATDADANLSYLSAGGIYLSTDRARTWSQRLQVVTPNWFDINELAWDPSSVSDGMSQVAYWSTSGEFDQGLYKTTDAGSTWNRIQTGTEYAYGSVAVHPTLGYVYVAKSTGFFRSTDGGANFTQILTEPLRGVSAVSTAPDLVAVSGTTGIFVSTDGGAHFSQRAGTGIPTYGTGPYGIRISPADPTRMMIAYNGPAGYWWDQNMWYSHDGGDSWQRPIVDDSDVYYSPIDQDDFSGKGRVWHPTNPDVLFITTDWIMKSTDGGAHVAMSNDGNNGTLVVAHWSFNPHDPDLVAFGIQDWISSLSTDGGWTWVNFPNFGDGGYGAYAFSATRLFIGAGGWSGPRTLKLSVDGGAIWSEPGATSDDTDPAVVGDPTDANVAFWSYWRTDDQGDSWQTMSGCDRVFTYNPVNAMELYGVAGGQYPPGTGNTVVTSSDHGVTWTPVFTTPNIIWDLAFDHVRNRFYVTMGDRGDTSTQLYQWQADTLTEITGRLPADQRDTREAQTVAVDPVDPDVVYAGGSRWDYLTDAAVMRSLDAGVTWTSLTLRPGDIGIDGGGRETGVIRVHPVTRYLWVTGGCMGIWKHTPPGVTTVCGDDQCDIPDETVLSCPQDCTSAGEACPNALCETGESCTSCPADCGACPTTSTGASACHATTSITVDGDAADWQNVAGIALPASRSLASEPEVATSDADCRAMVRSAWDATNLYVLVEVIDDQVIDDSTAPAHLDDGVELYLDGGHDAATSYDTNDFQLTVDVGNSADGVRADELIYAHASSQSAAGYVIEYAVPWTALGGSPSPSRLIGFDIALNDDDDGGDSRESQLVLYGSGDGWFDPSDMGDLALSASTCGCPVDDSDCTPPYVVGAPSSPSCGCASAGPDAFAWLLGVVLIVAKRRASKIDA